MKTLELLEEGQKNPFQRNVVIQIGLKCDCDQIFISVFSMIVKNVYKEVVTQNFSVISHIWPELHDDDFEFWRPPLKSAILESSSVRESVTS